jgi:hypothetical protein
VHRTTRKLIRKAWEVYHPDTAEHARSPLIALQSAPEPEAREAALAALSALVVAPPGRMRFSFWSENVETSRSMDRLFDLTQVRRQPRKVGRPRIVEPGEREHRIVAAITMNPCATYAEIRKITRIRQVEIKAVAAAAGWRKPKYGTWERLAA